MKLNFKIKIGSRELYQNIFCNPKEILIESGEKKIIFFEELNECFNIDEKE